MILGLSASISHVPAYVISLALLRRVLPSCGDNSIFATMLFRSS